MGRLSIHTERSSTMAVVAVGVAAAAAIAATVTTASFVLPRVVRVVRVVVAVSSSSSSSSSSRKKRHPTTATATRTRDADERICLVTEDNQEIEGGGLRGVMRRDNLWHRATYCLVVLIKTSAKDSSDRNEEAEVNDNEEGIVLVQKRSMLKDYCPGKLDPLPGGVVEHGESYRQNAVRELAEEMGIIVRDDDDDDQDRRLQRLFTFPYQDDRVKVWGEFFECRLHTANGSLDDIDIALQPEEVEAVLPMTWRELRDRLDHAPHEFMPDAKYALQLYCQRRADRKVRRRRLHGYSSGDLDRYMLRPPPQVIFFDCDDCLYFDGWQVAQRLTAKIDEWCVHQRGLPPGRAYQLYHQYGTALRGLRAEGYVDDTDQAVDAFLQAVHDVSVHDLIDRDEALREMILAMDPTIPRYVFTASVRDHAERCLRALGIDDLFVDIIDCKMCHLETKHSPHSFRVAMDVAGVQDPERCIFLDDNVKNIDAARQVGWRSILVGKVGRDCGKTISSDHAELEIDRIHDVRHVLPELFSSSSSSKVP